MNDARPLSTSAQWNKVLKPYAMPSTSRSLAQLALTTSLFGAFMSGACAMGLLHPLLAIPMALTAGLLLVRLFIIQHDCGHRSYFRSKAACDIVGRLLGVLTFVPYGYWRRDHDKHHATSGNLDHRGHGDIDTMTVAEFLAAGPRQRMLYRLYRSPVVLLAVAPAWQFILRYRLPIKLGPRGRIKTILGVLGHDVALAAVLGSAVFLLGWKITLTVWLTAVLTGGTAGLWLFYVQHCFPDAYWERNERWSIVDSSLKGCSYYRLPPFLHWLTGNIGYHHVHHLSARIPNYNLPSAHQEIASRCTVPSLGIKESLGTIRLALWCERKERMVSFKEAVCS